MRGMNSWIVLLAIFAPAAYCYAQGNASRGAMGGADTIASEGDRSAPSEEEIDDPEDYGLHVVNPGRLESHKYFQQMILAPSEKDCEEWSRGDSRTGMLFSISGTSRLFIGKRGDTEQRGDGANVDPIEKNYDVTSLTIGGNPLEGNVIVTLPASDMEEERDCLEKLRGVPIQWAVPTGEANYVEGAVEVVVQDVQFFREARLEGSGEITTTGAFLAKLIMSESWISMVFREMKAHVWGIAGSALLMMLAATAGWLMRVVRKVVGGASINLETLSRIRSPRKKLPDTATTHQAAPDVDGPAQLPNEHTENNRDDDTLDIPHLETRRESH